MAQRHSIQKEREMKTQTVIAVINTLIVVTSPVPNLVTTRLVFRLEITVPHAMIMETTPP